MEFADPQKQPEKAPEPPRWESLQGNDAEQGRFITGYGRDYGKDVPGFQVSSFDELPFTAPSREEVESRDRDTRIAQSLGEESGVRWDPISQLFTVIVGGAIVGAKKTIDAASDLYQQVMKSTQDHGGGKNDQHGKSEDRPSDIKRLEELNEQIKNASGNEKKKLQTTVNNLKKAMAARRKGENHSRKAKK
jgi:hypothetical protein